MICISSNNEIIIYGFLKIIFFDKIYHLHEKVPDLWYRSYNLNFFNHQLIF